MVISFGGYVFAGVRRTANFRVNVNNNCKYIDYLHLLLSMLLKLYINCIYSSNTSKMETVMIHFDRVKFILDFEY